MKKLQLIPITFSLALIATNWFSSKSYDRTEGLTEQSVNPAMFGVIFSVAAVWFLGKHAYQSFRDLLASGIKIEKGKRLVSFWPILYLLPLLIHNHRISTILLQDGTTVTHSYGYGTEYGRTLFLLGALVIILFQLVAEMEFTKKNKGEPVGSHNSGGCAPSV